jgi:hypothetical protein
MAAAILLTVSGAADDSFDGPTSPTKPTPPDVELLAPASREVDQSFYVRPAAASPKQTHNHNHSPTALCATAEARQSVFVAKAPKAAKAPQAAKGAEVAKPPTTQAVVKATQAAKAAVKAPPAAKAVLKAPAAAKGPQAPAAVTAAAASPAHALKPHHGAAKQAEARVYTHPAYNPVQQPSLWSGHSAFQPFDENNGYYPAIAEQPRDYDQNMYSRG